MDKQGIGKTIAELRKAKGWTQIELAEQINVSDKAVSKWESGGGFPEYTTLLLLAGVFGVSLDYLMTGKEVQPQIMTISKAELCAKNDDVALLKEINYQQKDESNKCLIDYIIQYESLKVFAALCATDKNALSSFGILTALKFCLLSNHIELLSKVGFRLQPQISYTFDSPEEIMGLLPVGALECFEKREGKDKYACILPDDFFILIATDKRINEKTINFLLGKQRGRQCVWYHAFPYLIDACYAAENFDLLERLLRLSEENNQYAYEKLKDKDNYRFNYFFIGFQYGNNGHGLVRILDKTLHAALRKNDFERIKRMNLLNQKVMKYYSSFKCGIVSEDEIRVARMRLDKSVSPQEILVQSAIHGGIVAIDELLASKDSALIAQALEKYPVSKFEQRFMLIEQLKQACSSDNWRCIFEYAIDHDETLLANYIMKGEKDRTEAWLSKKEDLSWYTGNSVYNFFERTEERENPNRKYFKLRNKERFSGEIRVSAHGLAQIKNPKAIYNINDLVEYIRLCKKQVIEDAKENFSKDKILAELSEEFFRNELAKNNVELVAVKLCVRLEAVLKSKYHYDGDFSEMLEKYCSQHGFYDEDDGWGYVERRTEKFVPYLQKLRKYRNSIVHSEKKVDGMTKQEIDFCIQYICGME